MKMKTKASEFLVPMSLVTISHYETPLDLKLTLSAMLVVNIGQQIIT